ncbi:hypothetical protein C3Y94_025865 [Rhizobium ruizarguesonis]|uniref:hypothetical protein n=1 Tax=Rhizobium ruizarguesonis TaxID=2081791 RepID=UPI00163A052A|nr:hypothetical protein [Rhizobium ruizarguesonis]MBC2806581.1 hypothetical protein [Rhizobium ruizarguesonis]
MRLDLQHATTHGIPTPITLLYTNHRGDTAERILLPISVWFGITDWHPEPQWFLKANDLEKQAERDFALKDFGAAKAITALPDDVIDQLLMIGPVYWGHVGPKPDAEHVADLTTALSKTREHFQMEAPDLDMHGLYVEGSDALLSQTGVSPNSPKHAQILTGAWNMMLKWAKAQRGIA